MIKLNNITKKYIVNKKEQCVLDHINIVLPNKGLIILKGKSGAGKTTLLNILAKIDRPTSGEIISDFEYRNTAIVYQDSQLIDDISVEQNLKIVADLYAKSYKDIEELLIKFNMLEYKDKKNTQLSGGEKQRISIIRALLAECPIILCDEPTANLDEENAMNVVSLLKEISNNKLVIVSTHDVDLFREYIDGEVELERGKVVNYNISKEDNSEVNVYNDIKKMEIRTLF